MTTPVVKVRRCEKAQAVLERSPLRASATDMIAKSWGCICSSGKHLTSYPYLQGPHPKPLSTSSWQDLGGSNRHLPDKVNMLVAQTLKCKHFLRHWIISLKRTNLFDTEWSVAGRLNLELCDASFHSTRESSRMFLNLSSPTCITCPLSQGWFEVPTEHVL